MLVDDCNLAQHEHTEQFFSIVQPYKQCNIFWQMKTYSVATPIPFWHLL